MEMPIQRETEANYSSKIGINISYKRDYFRDTPCHQGDTRGLQHPLCGSCNPVAMLKSTIFFPVKINSGKKYYK